MTRTEYLKDMVKKANKLMNDYSSEKDNELWNMAYDWNVSHDVTEEIIMTELWEDEDGNDADEITGFSIEDDRWFYKD